MFFEKPLMVLDIEATGLDVEKDRIVELSLHLIVPEFETLDNGRRKMIGVNKSTRTRRFNPEIPIPQAASDIHGIKDEDVADLPPFAKFAGKVLEMLEGCAIVTFNGLRYDLPMLRNEFARAGIGWNHHRHELIDVGNLYKIMEPRTLSAGVKHYLGREHEGAHGAEADTIATGEILLAMFRRYRTPDFAELWTAKNLEELAIMSNHGRRVADLSGKLYYDETGELFFSFGKETKDKPVREHPDFVQWMRTKDFPADTMLLLEDF